MITTNTITHLTHSSGLKLAAAIAYKIQREGVSAIPQELLDHATPEQAEALLQLAGYRKNHPIFKRHE